MQILQVICFSQLSTGQVKRSQYFIEHIVVGTSTNIIDTRTRDMHVKCQTQHRKFKCPPNTYPICVTAVKLEKTAVLCFFVVIRDSSPLTTVPELIASPISAKPFSQHTLQFYAILPWSIRPAITMYGDTAAKYKIAPFKLMGTYKRCYCCKLSSAAVNTYNSDPECSHDQQLGGMRPVI